MLCAVSVTAGSKSFTKCGPIEPRTTPSSISAINYNTAPGSFNLKNVNKNVNNQSFFPLQTDRKSSSAEQHFVERAR
jgi:hypothetical protein